MAVRDIKPRLLIAGLFLATLSSLLLELLDARLLSVLTWYHVSFVAISLAMLGTAAGAVAVFLSSDRIEAFGSARTLTWLVFAFALAIPITHVLLLRSQVPTLDAFVAAEIWPIVRTIVLLSVPFLISGAAITVALTRVGGRIGVLYGADLIGASAGCLLIVPLLEHVDIFSAALVTGGLAAAAAAFFSAFAAVRLTTPSALLSALLILGAGFHVAADAPIGISGAKGLSFAREHVQLSQWNAHSNVTIFREAVGPPFFWGQGKGMPYVETTLASMVIDGSAGTPLTKWDGDPDSLWWVQYDITSLPYHLRTGDVGIIGVGGGRDILSAIWARARSILAIEINGIFVDVLTRSHRDFANIANRDEVRIVHDEARSYLTRSDAKFDVLQMSLVDTWAATGAGAFTLTENALYTVEGWKLFLSHLKPTGLLSTSRWFAPDNVSETSRLLSLCVQALLESGVERPADHMALLRRDRVATLLVSPSPLSEADVAKLKELRKRFSFKLLVVPGVPSRHERLARIVGSTSKQELAAAVADDDYDFSAPTDARPYFFNMLKPGKFYRLFQAGDALRFDAGVVFGNLRATTTLILLLGVALVLVALIIFVPLVAAGLPAMRSSAFAYSVGYFATIGYGFMSIQIPLLQRFSVYIGHPVYVYSVILFTMIFFAGLGSLASERIDPARQRWYLAIPVAIASALLLLTFVLPPVLEATIHLGMLGRCAVVIALTAPLSVLLGLCFPLGLRIVSRLSGEAAPWMWGINGAAGVLASILGVLLSLWVGIHVNLLVAAALYLGLAFFAHGLTRELRSLAR